MRDAYKKASKSYFILAIFSAMVLLAYFSSQTVPMQRKSKTHQEPSSLEIEAAVPPITEEITTTTSTTIEEVVTTIPEITTTIVDTTVTTKPTIRTTTTEPYIPTPSSVVISGREGPPHNTTTLVGCISWYESNWGLDPNVFQFEQGTWETYGGRGSPSNASYSEQEAIFWIAWEDNGPHHWAAQKGRCF